MHAVASFQAAEQTEEEEGRPFIGGMCCAVAIANNYSIYLYVCLSVYIHYPVSFQEKPPKRWSFEAHESRCKVQVSK